MAKIADDLAKRGARMRFIQRQLKNNVRVIEWLPPPFDRLLSTATNEIVACCSLARYSAKRCDLAAELLDEAEELLRVG